MKTHVKIIFGLIAALMFAVSSNAQDASDVEPKPYGSYTGGGIDTVDLTTGNLFLHIPLLSYPQMGKLPPLTFSIELNNAPYNESGYEDPSATPVITYALAGRYDVAPPGSPYYLPGSFSASSVLYAYTNGVTSLIEELGATPQKFSSAGAYISSSLEGGIANQVLAVCPTLPCPASFLRFSAIDPEGKTHALASDLASYPSSDIYRAIDGTGYTFVPDGSCNAWSEKNCWSTASILTNGGSTSLKSGKLISPSGISYSTSIGTYPIPSSGYPAAQLLTSTEKDSLNNSITRGPWYWSGYPSWEATAAMQSFYSVTASGSPAHWLFTSSSPSLFLDSAGRHIPDIITMEQALGPVTSGFPVIDWNVPGISGGTKTYEITYQSVGGNTAFGLNPNGAYDPAYYVPANGWGIKTIQLPNGTQWKFDYDGADLQKVTTPSGGSISYTYTTNNISGLHFSANTVCNGLCHAVHTRTESDGTHSWTTTYSYAVVESPSNCPSLSAMATTERDDLGNDIVHTFCGLGAELGAPTNASSYHETKTDYYQGLSTATAPLLLKTVSTQYEYTKTADSGLTDVVPTQVVSTIQDSVAADTSNSVTTTSKYSGDTGMNQPLFQATTVMCMDDVYYNETTAASGAVNIQYIEPVSQTISAGGRTFRKRSTTFKWQQDANYLNQNILDIPYLSVISDGTSDYTQTIYHYDYDEAGAPIGTYGMQTAVTKGLSTDVQVTTKAIFNGMGMPTSTVDANGNTTSITYDSTGIFPSQVQRPNTGEVTHIDGYTRDSSFGKVLTHTDENGNVTTYHYDDVARVTDVTYPTTPSGTAESIMCYTDEGGSTCPTTAPPYSVYITTVASPSPSVLTIHTYDGLGRKIQDTLQSDPYGPIIAKTDYDEYGRAVAVYNPYRSIPAPGDPSTGSTQNTYDALGRIVKQVLPDGNITWSCYDNLSIFSPKPSQQNCSWPQTSDIRSDWVDTTDEAGRHLQHLTDPLGRLVTAVEPDPDAASTLKYITQYQYDPLDNLTWVSQWGGSVNAPHIHFRSFSYDSLSRLKSSYNPETYTSGSFGENIIYHYDANGNLTSKTDTRGIMINYSPSGSPIDALNRVTQKTYSDGEPSVSFVYDNASISNGKGRLYQEYTGSSGSPITQRTVLGYDAMGRITSEQRCALTSNCAVSSSQYTMNFTYDAAGRLTSYPGGYSSTNAFSQSYDAAGRLLNVTGLQGGVSTTLFSNPQYIPSGALSAATLGSGLGMARTYDVRQRVTSETDSGVVTNTTSITLMGSEQTK